MRIVTEVAEGELRLMVHVHSRAIAIAPRLGRVQGDVLLQIEFGGAAQRLAQDLGFVAELRGVVDVLVVTAAAAGEVRDSWAQRARAKVRARGRAVARTNPERP